MSAMAPPDSAHATPSAFPVISTTGKPGRASCTRDSSSTPDMTGMTTSAITTSQSSSE